MQAGVGCWGVFQARLLCPSQHWSPTLERLGLRGVDGSCSHGDDWMPISMGANSPLAPQALVLLSDLLLTLSYQVPKEDTTCSFSSLSPSAAKGRCLNQGGHVLAGDSGAVGPPIPGGSLGCCQLSWTGLRTQASRGPGSLHGHTAGTCAWGGLGHTGVMCPC